MRLLPHREVRMLQPQLHPRQQRVVGVEPAAGAASAGARFDFAIVGRFLAARAGWTGADAIV